MELDTYYLGIVFLKYTQGNFSSNLYLGVKITLHSTPEPKNFVKWNLSLKNIKQGGILAIRSQVLYQKIDMDIFAYENKLLARFVLVHASAEVSARFLVLFWVRIGSAKVKIEGTTFGDNRNDRYAYVDCG